MSSSRTRGNSTLTRRPGSQQGSTTRRGSVGLSQGSTSGMTDMSMAREPTPIGGGSGIRSTSTPIAPMPQMQRGAPPSTMSIMMMGAGSPSPNALSLGSNNDMIKFRSVSEKRIATEILDQEGQWDPDNQVYLTRQRQLQERTKRFSDLQQTVRYSPSLSYVEQGNDLEFPYPNAPSQLLKHHYTPHSHLSEADPRPVNIERKQRDLLKNQQERKQRGVASLLSGTAKSGGFSSQKEAEETISELEKELKATALRSMRPDSSCASSQASIRPYGGGLSPQLRAGVGGSAIQRERGSTSTALGLGGATTDEKRGAAAASSSSTSALNAGPRPLPLLEENHSGYSSLLMQLRKTKGEVQQHHKDLSTIRSILSMDGSADLKRTITRMFADPKNADAISREEHERREQLFEDERKRTIQHQMSLLKEERDVMEGELAQLQM